MWRGKTIRYAPFRAQRFSWRFVGPHLVRSQSQQLDFFFNLSPTLLPDLVPGPRTDHRLGPCRIHRHVLHLGICLGVCSYHWFDLCPDLCLDVWLQSCIGLRLSLHPYQRLDSHLHPDLDLASRLFLDLHMSAISDAQGSLERLRCRSSPHRQSVVIQG
ncbi:hypothetical protein BDZ85DRAFT_260114 [Elsinoe ampelina]|uniref:Uncharacterized protein n=1 Tax=Elsinoe ampelina TaxID=302913 RepID=A0A6A6GEL9_9PEZI|nr:hypothetical protein BDZ85DRAFT_260114 [Elsinoe ampelina]